MYGFGEEDFLRISSCPYSAKSLPSHGGHVFWQIKIWRTFFERGHPRNIPVKLFQNLTRGFRGEDFLIISSCPYRAKSPLPPPPWRPCFSTDQNFANNFWKGLPKEQSCEIISKFDQHFQRRRFLKNSLKKFHFVSMATRVLDGIKFCEQFLYRTTQGTFLPLMFKEIADDAGWTMDTGWS